MHRYMIHLKNRSYAPRDASDLLKKARSLISDSNIIIRDARVSNKYLEFDTSISENEKIEDIIRKLRYIGDLSEYEEVIDRSIEKGKAIKYAITLFNDEKYWGAHEILESIWKKAHGEEKDVLNGIILIAAAFVHDEKDESSICLSILKRAMDKLKYYNGMYFGINIDQVKLYVSEMIKSQKIDRFVI